MKGISVLLHVKTPVGTDTLNNPVFDTETVLIPGVLIGLPNTEDIESSISLYGKRIEYMLGIPKGDAHVWTDTTVEFFGKRYRTFGDVIEGIEDNVPGPWHKKVRVERFG